ncbi:cytochrome P450 [Mycena galopus ATCC 62051]|nr:cytochrome P450 [Mycena galopus ATCC 62051]
MPTPCPPLVGFWCMFAAETNTALISICFIFVLWGLCARRSAKHDAKMYDIGGYPIVTTWLFFTKRYDFITDTFKRTGLKMFRFRVLQHHVVALSGEEGRKIFFSEKNFDSEAGYRILGVQAPDPRELNIETSIDGRFVKHVQSLLRKDRMMEVIPHLLEDVNQRMDNWGNNGKINPFEEMHDLVFQMTVRMGTCRELADNQEDTARLSELFLLHEQAASLISLLLPWLPGPAKQTKKKATRGLFEILSHYVDLRRKSNADSADALDMLIRDGHDNATTIAYTLGIIFAGVLNTGMITCWALVHLGNQPKWKEKVTDEVRGLLLNHDDASESGPDSLQCRFSAVPLNAWEEEMPVLDLVIKETIRFTMTGTALRRNIGGDMAVGENVIRHGDFVAYSLGDAHFDGQIYPDPLSFDPARFLNEEERQEDELSSKVTFPFLGWGAGRHPCAGMRAAKLEIKLAIAVFLFKFDYDIVDASGKYTKRLPQPDRNNLNNAKPIGDPCYLKFERKI